MSGHTFGKRCTYANTRFESRLEARMALFLDMISVQWRYEPDRVRFTFTSGTEYAPDFFLQQQRAWLETKGEQRGTSWRLEKAIHKAVLLAAFSGHDVFLSVNSVPRAVDLALKVVADFKPHVLPHGSDAFDFSTIGRWDVDPDEVTTDVWQQINRPYLQLMRSFRDAAPGAISPFLVGNHDERVHDFFTRQAPQFRYTVSQLFVDMIRKAGGLWLGWETGELELPGLLLTHGTRIVSGVYPARRLADYCATQHSALAGHVHRFDTWTKRGSRDTVTYQTSGCLCNLQPKWSHRRENWQHGIVLVTVTDGVAFFEPVPFVDYKAVWSGKVYTA